MIHISYFIILPESTVISHNSFVNIETYIGPAQSDGMCPALYTFYSTHLFNKYFEYLLCSSFLGCSSEQNKDPYSALVELSFEWGEIDNNYIYFTRQLAIWKIFLTEWKKDFPECDVGGCNFKKYPQGNLK